MQRKRFGKDAGNIILIALIIISVAEVIFRATTMGLDAMSTANFGEQLIVIALATTILILTAKGKDRACYILYGAWIAYFVLDQLFELPGDIITLIHNMANVPIPSLGGIARIAISICIIGIGVLLVEYMNDSTIFNKLFNTLCVIALLFVLISVITGVCAIATDASLITNDIFTAEEFKTNVILDVFNNLYRGVMIFLSAFFAYDSAKAQLEKTKLDK